MKALQEIASISGFKPSGGELLKVFNFMNDDLCRAEALAQWEEEGKSQDHFRRSYKNLKDQLLDGIFKKSFRDYPTVKKYRIQCWKLLSQSKILLIAEKKTAAVKVMVEAIRLAKKCGITEIVLLLSLDLENYYGVINPDIARFRRYRKLVRECQAELKREVEIMSLFASYSFHLSKNKDCSSILSKIEDLRPAKSEFYKYNLYYFQIEVYRGIQLKEGSIVLQACIDAIQYFEKQKTILPYTIRWSFTRKMIPFLIAQGRFAQAEIRIKECLELPRKGSYNWHISLLHLADLGFKSDKPHIAYDAWKMAHYGSGKIDIALIKELWNVVMAYLVIYHKMGRIEITQPFRLGRFLNSVPLCSQDKSGVNTVLIVAELMHYLLDGRKNRFMARVEKLDRYAHDHLKGKELTRTRYFFKMVMKIEMADYYRIRTEAMARRYWNLLKRTTSDVNINLMETELIPFEVVWTWMLDKLK